VSETKTFAVPAIHCSHCAAAIKEEVTSVEGVDAVDVDLDAKLVTIRGNSLDDRVLREAIAEAGYEAAWCQRRLLPSASGSRSRG
jgi:copper chaperone